MKEILRSMIEYMKLDIERHKSNRFQEIGSEYAAWEKMDGQVPVIAFDFWDSWIDERNHGFPGFYDLIEKDDWPILALSVIEDLESGQDACNPVVVQTFSRK